MNLQLLCGSDLSKFQGVMGLHEKESEGGEKNPSDCSEEGQEVFGEIQQIDSNLCKAYMSRALVKDKPCFQFLK